MAAVGAMAFAAVPAIAQDTSTQPTTPATMVDDASVNHVPVGTGGHGNDELSAF